MKKKKKGFLLAFPAISGFLFFYLIPFLIVLWYSVSFGIGKREFVGLDNYKELFKNTMFLLAVKNTCKYMLVTIPVTLKFEVTILWHSKANVSPKLTKS